MSQRRKAEIGLLSACLLLAGCLGILYQGSRDAKPAAQQTRVVAKQANEVTATAMIKVANARK